jgi:hypothetical protein
LDAALEATPHYCSFPFAGSAVRRRKKPGDAATPHPSLSGQLPEQFPGASAVEITADVGKN